MPVPVTSLLNLEVVTKGLIAGGGSNTVNTVNVFQYFRTTNVNAISKANIDAAFQAAIIVPLGAALNGRWTQQNNSFRFLDDAMDAYLDFSHAVVGGVAGDSMTTVQSAFIFQKTAFRGKHYRGGKHFGPLSEADTTTPDSDIFNAAAIARFAVVVAAMQTGFTDSDGNIWKPQIVARSLSQLTSNPVTIVSNEVTTTALNKRVGRMRRREAKSVY